MPELPEVETIVRGLEPFFVGNRIVRCLVRRRDLRRPVPDDLEHRCVGSAALRVSRRAKYALIHLDNDLFLLMHFGMSGKLLCAKAESDLPDMKHEHIRWLLEDGSAAIFVDPRRFGMVEIYAEQEAKTAPPLRRLGVEPLADDLSPELFHQIVIQHKRSIRSVLMDAHVIVGIGNIYVSEALFLAGLIPEKLACSLSFNQNKRLLHSIRMVLTDAIASGGSTLRDYVRPSGDAGYFAYSFNVYGRERKPCVACGSLIKRTIVSNRSVFHCPNCQRP